MNKMNLQEQSEQERIIQNTEELNERIDHLEKMLHDALHHTYVGETYDLYVRDGELNITYQEGKRELTMCTEQLLRTYLSLLTKFVRNRRR